MMLRFASMLFCCVLLAACAPSYGSKSYKPGEVGQSSTTEIGHVISVRPVQIEGTDSGVGKLGGAAAGGVAGSMIGTGDRTQALGAIGGAIVGGIVGAASEKAVTKAQGAEYVIETEMGDLITVVQGADENIKAGGRVFIMRGDRVRIAPY